MNVALYIRVSTDDQLEFSPDAQKRALSEYAKRNGMIVNDRHVFIDEGISGTNAQKRPGFQKMIATAKKKPKPFDVILVHKFDRFARSREDSVVYKSLLRKECDIKVISITEQLEDDKFSVILEAMLEAMAEYYSLNLSDEVMKGMAEKARRGGIQASAAFGYRVENNNYILVPEQAAIVKLIYDKFINGDLGYGEICKQLTILGIKNVKGNFFESRNVKYILGNPVYCGLVRWNYSSQKGKHKINKESEWIIREGTHEPIVSREIYNMAIEKLNNNNSKYANRKPLNNDYVHWLGGLLRCSKCGGTLTYAAYSKSSLSANSKYKGYFLCNKYRKGSCISKTSITIKDSEKYILEQLSKDAIKLKNNEYINVSPKNKNTSSELDILNQQLSRILKQMENAKKSYLVGIDTIEEYKENKISILKEKNDIEKQINLLESNPVDTKSLFEKFQTAIEMIKSENIDVKTLNNFLKKFISKIVIDAITKRIDIYYFA